MSGPAIAVVRMLPGLGDLVCAVPALRAIRQAEPGAHVTLIGLPSASWFADRFPHYIDHWLACGTCPGLPESAPDPTQHDRFLNAARAAHFDLALQLHGDGRVTNAFTAGLGAARWAGPPLPVPPDRHEVDRCLDVVEAAGIPVTTGTELEFPVHDTDGAELDARIGTLPARYAVVHPGSSHPERRWPAPLATAVAAHLAHRIGHVYVTGSEGEAAAAQRIADGAGKRVTNLAGRTSTGALAALADGAQLVVCNDTGVAHLAGAVGTPTLTVFARSDRRRWAVRGPRHREIGGPDGRWPSVAAVHAALDASLAVPAR